MITLHVLTWQRQVDTPSMVDHVCQAQTQLGVQEPILLNVVPDTFLGKYW